MMVWMDVPADKEEEFNHWYNEEHLQELLAVPGVLNAARYEAVRGGPKHLACYELKSTAVVDTEAFTSRKPTEWVQRIGPRVIATNRINNVYQMIYPKELSPSIASAVWLRVSDPGQHTDNQLPDLQAWAERRAWKW